MCVGRCLRLQASPAGLLIAAVLASGCGPIEAPPGMADLRANPAAFQEQFDQEVGVHRLVLLLSPA